MKESATKTRILDVASRLFYDQGYNSTGINQIIDEAGIAKASLYTHFPSKRDLLAAYIQKAEESWFVKMNDYLAPFKDPKEKLLALFDFRVDRQLANNFAGCQFTKISAEVPKDDLRAFELVGHQKNLVKSFIAEQLEQINLSQPQTLSKEMLADTFFLMLEGATVAAAVYKDASAIQKAKVIAEKLL